MHAVTVEISGRDRLLTDEEAYEEALTIALRAPIEYEEMRSTLAERFGWTFDTIDAMPFDQINDAWRHLAGRKKPLKLDLGWEQQRSWADYLDEVLEMPRGW
jgi:hypothetical protein